MRINQKGLKRSAAECHCLLFLPAEQSLEPCYSAALCPGVQLRHVRWGPARLRWCWPISACMDGWHVAGADSTTWAFCLLQNSSWGSFRFLLATDTDRGSSRCPVQLLYLSLRWLQGTVPFSSSDDRGVIAVGLLKHLGSKIGHWDSTFHWTCFASSCSDSFNCIWL